MIRPVRLFVIAALTAGLLAAMAAPATAEVRIGITQPNIFALSDLDSKPWNDLKVRKTRVIVPWDIGTKGDREYKDYFNKLREKRIQPMIHFNKNCPGRNCSLPSVSKFKSSFEKFLKRHGDFKVYGTWNEVNHGDQPTRREPKRAAEYFNAMQDVCTKRGKKCTIVGVDLLDDGSEIKFLREWLKTAKKPKYIGLHNYKDINDRKLTRTRNLFKALKDPKTGKVKYEIWLTEIGGINFFKTGKGKVVRKRSNERQAKVVQFLMDVLTKSKYTKEFQGRITRAYYYHWRSDGETDDVRFDSALLNPLGQTRPAYDVIAKYKKFIK